MPHQNKILITGGAGYIGSHTNALLNALGFKTLVLDNLIYGHKEALQFAPLESICKELRSQETLQKFGQKSLQESTCNLTPSAKFLAQLDSAFRLRGGGGNHTSLESHNPKHNHQSDNLNHNPNYNTTSTLQNLKNAHKNTTFIQADLSDKNTLTNILQSHKIDCVLHFAAFAYVGESVQNPSKYYRNNVVNTLNLLESMQECGIKRIIFSSTCATYGTPLSLPITESHPQNPINPYGYSKLVVEQMLKDFARAYGLEYVILRYFNAAGASTIFNIGESHNPETHLIPLALQTALKQRERFSVFGDDYDTRDGSCVRDFIHIDDLGAAHILAFEYLQNGGQSDVFNLGNGAGFSIFEVLSCAQKLIGAKIPYTIEKRRDGDPAVLVGDSTKAREILGWNPQFASLEAILESALFWHKNARY